MLTVVLVYFFDLFVLAMEILIIALVISSWVAPDSAVHRLAKDLTDPVLAQVRRLFPKDAMLDLAPLLTLVGLNLLQVLLHNLLSSLI